MKARKWSETTLKLSKRAYKIPKINSVSIAEQQRLIALDSWLKKPLLPEEWVIVRT